MNDWNIQSRAHACQACAKPFEDKQPCHTLLFDEKHDFSRMDICEACWQAQFSQGATERKGFVSHWRGIYEPPPAAAPDAIQKESAESLLRRIIEIQDEKYSAAGFILAVMLERKRILKVKEQLSREGRRVFVYEQPKTGDLFTVGDPNLQLNQLDDVQRQVADLLEHGFNDAPAPVANDSSTTVPVSAEAAAPAEPAQT